MNILNDGKMVFQMNGLFFEEILREHLGDGAFGLWEKVVWFELMGRELIDFLA
ncbi:hypothetical protein [Bacillus altitudinis]|uniref:hypothetical protein n=1 Tax=Bacillus altitudinis TaxID=293387 RepID=UPI001643F9DD|nr:hypothetical protein [Bacillus altitudinis]